MHSLSFHQKGNFFPQEPFWACDHSQNLSKYSGSYFQFRFQNVSLEQI